MGMPYVHLQEKVPGIVESGEYSPEPIPVNIPLIGEPMLVLPQIVMKMEDQKPVAEFLQEPKTFPVNVLVTGIIAEPYGAAAELL